MSGPPSRTPARSLRRQFAVAALVAVAGAACGAGVVGGDASWFIPALVAAVLGCRVLAAPPLAGGEGLLGPLFFSDVVRLARRGRGTLLRCAYALALLGALCFAYHERFPTAPLLGLSSARGPDMLVRELPRFAEMLTLVLLLAQALAVLALTPAYVAGAVAEEK